MFLKWHMYLSERKIDLEPSKKRARGGGLISFSTRQTSWKQTGINDGSISAVS